MKSISNALRRSLLLAASVAFVNLSSGDAAAQDVSFEGKTIEWIVPYTAGGGTDVVARFNAPFFSKYLPGNPTIVVVNEPGGGSTKGANLFASRAEPDGLTALWTSGSTQIPYLLGDPRVRYDYNDWQAVIVSMTGTNLVVKPELEVSSIGELGKLRGQTLVAGGTSPTGAAIISLLSYDLLGLEVKTVFGFKGGGDVRLAFERGETNILNETTPSYLQSVAPSVEQGDAKFIFSFGVVDENGDLQRDPTFPDMPHFGEAYEAIHGALPSGPEYDKWLAFYIAAISAQKMTFLPGDTPRPIVEAYQNALRLMVEDPEYIAKRDEVLGRYDQVTGRAAEILVEKVVQIPDAARAEVVEMLETRYGVSLKP